VQAVSINVTASPVRPKDKITLDLVMTTLQRLQTIPSREPGHEKRIATQAAAQGRKMQRVLDGSPRL
jgi:hypothetical protein